MNTLLFVLAALTQTPPPADIARWERQARNVTIIRDDWGIAHVYGKTDADAVFGMEYAQAEDDFNRIETNYLNSLGRLAEAEGEAVVFQDLRQKLFVDPDSLRAQYARSPLWLRRLMDAFADGLNYFLYKHPEVKPRVITRFEPWMALSFTEGSIGGDIERISVRDLAVLYGDSADAAPPDARRRLRRAIRPGSNGIAIAPAPRSESPRAALDQPPHLVLLPLRAADGQRGRAQRVRRRDVGPVLHLSGIQRQRGLDAHLERRGQHRRVRETSPRYSRDITVPFKTDTGIARKTFTVQYTPHGPIVRKRR